MTLSSDPEAWSITVGALVHPAGPRVRRDVQLDSLEALLLEHAASGLAGLPVVDEHDRLVGVVTPTDVVRDVYERNDTGERVRRDRRERRQTPELAWGFHEEQVLPTVGDIMQPTRLTLPSTTSIAAAAELLTREHALWAPVVDHEERLVGAISTLDLTRWLAAHPSARERDGGASLEAGLEQLARLRGWQVARLWRLGADQDTLEVAAAYFAPELPPATLGALAHQQMRVPPPALLGEAWTRATPAWREALDTLPASERVPGLVSGCVIPVGSAAAGELTAMVELYSTASHVPRPAAIEELRRASVALLAHAAPAQRGESLAPMHDALRHAPMVLFAIDDEGRFTLFEGNEVATVGLGLIGDDDDGGAIIGRLLFERGGVVPEFRESCRLALAGQGHTASFPLAGTARFIEGRYTPLRRADGRVTGAIGVLLDVTEHEEAQAARARAELRLLEADRLTALGSLAGGVAHQINNALTHVRLSLGRLISLELSRRPSTPVRAHRVELLRDVREGIGRVEEVVSELRQFSHVDEGRDGAVELRAVLDTVLKLAAHEIRHRARLLCDFEDVRAVRGSEGALLQLFLNLIMTAAQSIPEGEAHLNEIRVGSRMCQGGERVEVTITDSGLGVPPELIDRGFDPFTTAQPTRRGRGLGLASCRELVKSLAGEIVVESTVGRGTRIRVLLPSSSETTAPPPSAPGEGDAPDTAQRRVLVIDDERAVGAAIAAELATHDVTVVASGREALELLHRDRDFDLVLCDLMMPEVTGMDLYDSLHLVDPRVAERIVFMTGGAFTPRAGRFLDEVPNPRLDKPFRGEALHELVQRAPRRVRRPVAASPSGPEELTQPRIVPRS